MKATPLIILASVTVILMIAVAFVTREERAGIEGRGEKLFPELRAQLNAVRTIRVTGKDQGVTLTHAGTHWAVKEKGGHEAASNRVRTFLIAMSELTILEPKTRTSKLYEKLGLLDAEADGSTSTHVTLTNEQGDVIAEVVLGNRRPSRGAGSGEEIYIRKPGDPQTWLVMGRLTVDKAPGGWLQKQILNVDIQRVRRVQITHPGGDRLTIEKDDTFDADFSVIGMPDTMKVASQFSVNSVADTFARLTADDVIPQAQIDAAFRQGVIATLETFDGLRVTARTAEKNGKHYLTASAEFDQSLVLPEPEPFTPESEEGPDAGAEGGKQDGKEPERASPPSWLKSPEGVQQEVKAFNERRTGWAYEIPTFRAESLTTRRSDLLTKKT